MALDGGGKLDNATCGDAAFFGLTCAATVDGNVMPGLFHGNGK